MKRKSERWRDKKREKEKNDKNRRGYGKMGRGKWR